MATRAELDEKARSLGINPDDYTRKAEVAAAIEDVLKAQAAEQESSEEAAEETPAVDPESAAEGTVLKPLVHNGRLVEPGCEVPDDLSEAAVETLRRQGSVA